MRNWSKEKKIIDESDLKNRIEKLLIKEAENYEESRSQLPENEARDNLQRKYKHLIVQYLKYKLQWWVGKEMGICRKIQR